MQWLLILDLAEPCAFCDGCVALQGGVLVTVTPRTASTTIESSVPYFVDVTVNNTYASNVTNVFFDLDSTGTVGLSRVTSGDLPAGASLIIPTIPSAPWRVLVPFLPANLMVTFSLAFIAMSVSSPESLSIGFSATGIASANNAAALFVGLPYRTPTLTVVPPR
jgi:hypothetical protein